MIGLNFADMGDASLFARNLHAARNMDSIIFQDMKKLISLYNNQPKKWKVNRFKGNYTKFILLLGTYPIGVFNYLFEQLKLIFGPIRIVFFSFFLKTATNGN